MTSDLPLYGCPFWQFSGGYKEHGRMSTSVLSRTTSAECSTDILYEARRTRVANSSQTARMVRSTVSSPTYHPTTPSIQPRLIHPAPPLLESPITSMILRTCCKASKASKVMSRGEANVRVRGINGICPAIVNRLFAYEKAQRRNGVCAGSACDSRLLPDCTVRYWLAPNSSFPGHAGPIACFSFLADRPNR